MRFPPQWEMVWKVELAEEQHEPPNMSVSIWCFLDLCGVRFYL
jgi:hypothetical protein